MLELLNQISVPDSIGATVTTALTTIIYLMHRRQRAMAAIAARDAIRGMAMLRMLRIATKNGLTAEAREDQIMDVYEEALSELSEIQEPK